MAAPLYTHESATNTTRLVASSATPSGFLNVDDIKAASRKPTAPVPASVTTTPLAATDGVATVTLRTRLLPVSATITHKPPFAEFLTAMPCVEPPEKENAAAVPVPTALPGTPLPAIVVMLAAKQPRGVVEGEADGTDDAEAGIEGVRVGVPESENPTVDDAEGVAVGHTAQGGCRRTKEWVGKCPPHRVRCSPPYTPTHQSS